MGLSFNGCSGPSVETETCNDAACPTWSNWSSWNNCSATCNGGTQSRNRECQNGEEDDCPGSSTDEQQCNRQSCDGAGFVYWEHTYGYASGWRHVQDLYLPAGDTRMDRCIAYCMSYTGCITAMVSTTYGYITRAEHCWISDRDFYYPYMKPYKREYSTYTYSMSLAVMQDYYQANSDKFKSYRQPDGTSSGSSVEIPGLCDKANTGFGLVDYRNVGAVSYSSRDDKNVIRDSDPTNCAAKCFETAGCSSFFVDGNGCTFIIGRPYKMIENADVSDSGMLNNICPMDTFKSTFTRKSQFYCLLWAPSEAENIADSIVRRNTGNADTPLRVWSFETISNNPLMKSSQYVSILQPNMQGNDRRYRPVVFSIETHVRIGEDAQTERKRRAADRESETIFIGEITEEDLEKFRKEDLKNAKQAAKERFIMPRTEDILAEIEAIEQQVTSFILDGGMEMPDNVGVAATGPIETVEFVQSAADGSVSADCSSGSCECSSGFIDNGNGCEAMTVEQAATTQAPTTQTPAATTNESTAVEVAEFLALLVNKLESVFEYNRPEKPRTHLMNKWQAIKTKFTNRYTEMTDDKGCNFSISYNDDSVDFNSINTCRVSFLFSPYCVAHTICEFPSF